MCRKFNGLLPTASIALPRPACGCPYEHDCNDRKRHQGGDKQVEDGHWIQDPLPYWASFGVKTRRRLATRPLDTGVSLMGEDRINRQYPACRLGIKRSLLRALDKAGIISCSPEPIPGPRRLELA